MTRWAAKVKKVHHNGTSLLTYPHSLCQREKRVFNYPWSKVKYLNVIALWWGKGCLDSLNHLTRPRRLQGPKPVNSECHRWNQGYVSLIQGYGEERYVTPLSGKYLELLKQKSFSILRSRFLKNPVVEEFTTEKRKTLWEKGKKALGVPVYKLTKYLWNYVH